MEYARIEILTSEAARYRHRPVDQAVIQAVRSRRIAARVHMYRGETGAYEGGDYATTFVLDAADNLPVKIEILLPAAETDKILPLLKEIVTEGLILVQPVTVYHHQVKGRLFPRDLHVVDIMTADPVSLKEDAPVLKAVRVLMASSFRSLPVVDQAGHVVGIVTDDDLVNRARLPVSPGLLRRLGVNPDDTGPEFAHLAGMRVSSIQTSPVDCVLGTDSVAHALDLMVRKGRRALPVVDATGRLVGICSRRDVLTAVGNWTKTLARWKDVSMVKAQADRVGDVMTGGDRYVSQGETLDAVGAIIIRSGARRVAVVDEQRHLLGVVAEQDILRTLEPQNKGMWGLLVQWASRLQGRKPLSAVPHQVTGIPAGSVMTSNPVSLREEDELGTAARLMVEHHVKELPVVDGQGRFAGFLSRQDVMRAMTAQSGSGPVEQKD